MRGEVCFLGEKGLWVGVRAVSGAGKGALQTSHGRNWQCVASLVLYHCAIEELSDGMEWYCMLPHHNGWSDDDCSGRIR